MNVPTYHKSPISLSLKTNSTFNILLSFYLSPTICEGENVKICTYFFVPF